MVIACCSVQTRRWNHNYMLFRNSVSFELLVLCSVSFKSRSWLSSSKSILLNILCGVHAARLSVKDDHHVFLACSATTPTILGDLRASARISVNHRARSVGCTARDARAQGGGIVRILLHDWLVYPSTSGQFHHVHGLWS